MITIDDLNNVIIEALKSHGGQASLVEICKYVWNNSEGELRNSGDLFYTWQYRIRWQGTVLRKEGTLKPADSTNKGIWELSDQLECAPGRTLLHGRIALWDLTFS